MIRQTIAVLCLSFVALQSSATACKDFSGTWTGQCQNNSGKVRNHSITIMQSRCDTVVLANRIFPIGKVIETRIPNGEYNVSFEVVNFINNCSELHYQYTGYAEVPGQPPVSINTATVFKRNGNVLVTETHQTENNFREACSYIKQ